MQEFSHQMYQYQYHKGICISFHPNKLHNGFTNVAYFYSQLKHRKEQAQYNKNKEHMQNQLNFSANFNTNQPPNMIGSPKFAQNYPSRPFDKTLPNQPIKHYTSNPNLSLQLIHPRQLQTPPDFVPFKSPPSIRNPEYRAAHLSPPNIRPRSDLTKSLIINQPDKRETPEEPISPKKEATRNLRRPRMSDTLDEAPGDFFQVKREEPAKEANFQKNKEEDKGGRQTPSFLNRANSTNFDLKRSSVIDTSFQHSSIREKKPRRVSVDDFAKIKQLGNGKYGRVYLVRQRYTNFICALKVIEKKLLHEQEITDQFIRQVKIQMFLNHPNIIKMYGCFHDNTNIYIILQVGTGGQLYHQLKKAQPLPQARIAFIMKQVCEAVNQIHSLRIIHRDIKPENIVMHDNIIKLCDFGWSVHQDNKLRTTFCGTPLYVCPEILKGREYDEKIDIWSIGIMMYEMVVGQNPFKITREEELIKIVKDEIKIPSYLFVANEVRDFLDRCLQKNPADRATIKELVNHPFFKKHQDKNDKTKLMTAP